MKNTILLLFSLLALAGVSSCKKSADRGDQILVRFQNNTDLNIDNAVMNFDELHMTAIGNIPAGGQTDYIPFDYFLIGETMPMGILQGTSAGNSFTASTVVWCGTGVTFEQLESGMHTVEIFPQTASDSTVYYYLRFAN